MIRGSADVQGRVSRDEFSDAVRATVSAGSQVVLTRYEATVARTAVLAGDVAEFSEGTAKRTVLEWGLQRAACGSVVGCTVTITSLSGRRRLQRLLQDANTVTIDFEASSPVEFDAGSPIAHPTAFKQNFVQAVALAEAPDRALADLAEDDFTVSGAPAFSTSVEYTVMLSDAADMAAAAASLRDPAALASNLADPTVTVVLGDLQGTNVPALPGPSPPPAASDQQPAADDAGADDGGVDWAIIGVVVVVVIVVGGAAAYYFLVFAPNKAMANAASEDKVEKKGWDNP